MQANNKAFPQPSIPAMSDRARTILREVVEAYIATGEPVGSKTLSQAGESQLSAASIRNIMAELEDQGLLMAPHISAGRLPTEAGLRFFVDGLLERGRLASDEKARIDEICAAQGQNPAQVFDQASRLLAGLSQCTGLVTAPTLNNAVRQLEFAPLSDGRALAILEFDGGQVENRVIDLPLGYGLSQLQQAGRYLSTRLAGRTLHEAREALHLEINRARAELDAASAQVVAAGLAVWSDAGAGNGYLIVRGQANLLEDVTALAQLERVRGLISTLESRESMLKLVETAEAAPGVQIFIGADNPLFSNTGCSLIVAPYHNAREQVVGAIGVVGPSRINYGRIVPMVDYTARVISRLLGAPMGAPVEVGEKSQ